MDKEAQGALWLNIELGEAGWTVASDALCRGCTVLWIMAHGPPWGMQLGLKIRYFQHLLLTRCIQCVWCFRQQSKAKQCNAISSGAGSVEGRRGGLVGWSLLPSCFPGHHAWPQLLRLLLSYGHGASGFLQRGTLVRYCID
jgi:hypothetical protein